MTSKLKNLDVSVQNLEVMQWAYNKKNQAKTLRKQDLLHLLLTNAPPT